MTKFVYTLCAVMMLAALPNTGEARFACARSKEGCAKPFVPHVVIGESVVIPKHYSGSEWTVQNQTDIYNGKKKFTFGSKCNLRTADALKVIGYDEKYVLISYDVSKRSDDARVCPDGAIFFVEPLNFDRVRMARGYEIEAEKLRDDKFERLKKLLKE